MLGDLFLKELELVKNDFVPLKLFQLRIDVVFKNGIGFRNFQFFAPDELQTLLPLVLVDTDAGGLLDEAEDLGWPHIYHLGDSTLHDKKVGVVDVEFDGGKKVAH